MRPWGFEGHWVPVRILAQNSVWGGAYCRGGEWGTLTLKFAMTGFQSQLWHLIAV